MHLIAGARGAMAGLMAEVVEDHVRTHLVDPETHPGALNTEARRTIARSRPHLPEMSQPMSRSHAIPRHAPHSHVFLGEGHEHAERRTWAVIWLCGAMMALEIGGGLLFGSIALVADGLHMSTHAGALLLAALAYRYARRHATDARFTFGTGKLGDLAGFTSAIVLAMIALLIGWEAIGRLLAPVPIAFAEAIPIACLGLTVNIASAWLLGGGASPSSPWSSPPRARHMSQTHAIVRRPAADAGHSRGRRAAALPGAAGGPRRLAPTHSGPRPYGPTALGSGSRSRDWPAGRKALTKSLNRTHSPSTCISVTPTASAGVRGTCARGMTPRTGTTTCERRSSM